MNHRYAALRRGTFGERGFCGHFDSDSFEAMVCDTIFDPSNFSQPLPVSGATPHLASLSLAYRPTFVFESNNPTLPITKFPNNQILVMILIRSLDLIMVPSKQEYFTLWKCTSSGSNIYKWRSKETRKVYCRNCSRALRQSPSVLDLEDRNSRFSILALRGCYLPPYQIGVVWIVKGHLSGFWWKQGLLQPHYVFGPKLPPKIEYMIHI